MITKKLSNNYGELFTVTKTNERRCVKTSYHSMRNHVIWVDNRGAEWIKAGYTWRMVCDGNDAMNKNDGYGAEEVKN